jgi:hypothetical protein
MVGITERNQQKLELANAGFSLKYIDEWIPKTTLYRHRASYNAEGSVSEDIGTMVRGVPGSPDYVLRKAKIGLFPWTPGESCKCQWCSVSKTQVVVETVEDRGEPVLSEAVEDKGAREDEVKRRFESAVGKRHR